MVQVKQFLLNGLKAMISPEPLSCSCCGKLPRMEGLNPLKLCKGCAGAIPWIRDIRCPVCGRAEDCPDCVRRSDPPLRMNRSAVRYDDRMRELLALYKYRGDERLQELLGGMLVQAYRMFPTEVKPDVLTYVPLSRDRYEERGFNQAERTALVLARLVKLPVLPLLTRLRNTEKMSLKSRQERLVNLQGVFAVDQAGVARLRKHFAGRRVIRVAVVDDVYTTGSTLHHCASAIREALPEAEVYGLCWAR